MCGGLGESGFPPASPSPHLPPRNVSHPSPSATIFPAPLTSESNFTSVEILGSEKDLLLMRVGVNGYQKHSHLRLKQ